MQTRQPFMKTTVSPTTAVVIGPQYCVPFPVELEIVRTVKTFANEFCVKNRSGNTVFNLQRPSLSVHKRCILLDFSGNPIVTLRRKRMTAHNRWQVFRGKSDQKHDLLFSVKRPYVFHRNTKLDVFLATNSEENVCDFKVESFSDGSCAFYAIQSGNIVAQMVKYTVPSIGYDKDKVVVKVEANVDSAFIVALIMQNRQPSVTTPVSPTTSVIGPSYCAPYPVQLEIVRSVNTVSDEISVKDIKGNTVFNLERAPFSGHKRCILLDPTGNPIVTLRRKIMTAHNRWQVFRGKSDQTDELLFSVKRSNFFQLNTKLDVFLDGNAENKVCDFKVEGSWRNGICDVSDVQSSNIVAK
ncbi:Protein LURP-one-related 15, partial [Mucuna pruriens]